MHRCGEIGITKYTKMLVGLGKNLCVREYKFDRNITVIFPCARHDVIIGVGVTVTLFLDSGNRPQVS